MQQNLATKLCLRKKNQNMLDKKGKIKTARSGKYLPILTLLCEFLSYAKTQAFFKIETDLFIAVSCGTNKNK